MSGNDVNDIQLVKQPFGECALHHSFVQIRRCSRDETNPPGTLERGPRDERFFDHVFLNDQWHMFDRGYQKGSPARGLEKIGPRVVYHGLADG